MTDRVQGQIFKVFEKDWNGKMLYSIKLENIPDYYRLGGKPAPDVVPGAVVEFEYDTSFNQKTGAKTFSAKFPITVKSAQAPAPVVPAGTTTASAAGQSMSWADKDRSIQYQSARKDALQFLDLVTREKAVKFPEAPAKKLAAVEAFLDKYTSSFYTDIGTLAAVGRASGETAEAEEPTPGQDDEE